MPSRTYVSNSLKLIELAESFVSASTLEAVSIEPQLFGMGFVRTSLPENQAVKVNLLNIKIVKLNPGNFTLNCHMQVTQVQTYF